MTCLGCSDTKDPTMPATPETIGTLHDLAVFADAAARLTQLADWLHELSQLLREPQPVTVRPSESVVCQAWQVAAGAAVQLAPSDLARLRISVWSDTDTPTTAPGPQLHGSAETANGPSGVGVPLRLSTPLTLHTRGEVWARNLDTVTRTIYTVTEAL